MNDTERLVRASFDAFRHHDPDGPPAALAEEVVHDIDEGPTEIGIEGLVVMSSGEHEAAEFTVGGTRLQTDGSPF